MAKGPGQCHSQTTHALLLFFFLINFLNPRKNEARKNEGKKKFQK